jgi:uncharacterized protein YsxB (DUF464 family)
MIRWLIEQENGLTDIVVYGHADYAEAGKDIVCSAVSSITITALNILHELGYLIDSKEGYGELRATAKTTDLVSSTICLVLEGEMEDLQNSYPDYIRRVSSGNFRNIANREDQLYQ